VLEGKRVMYFNQKGDRHPRGTLELNAGSRLKKIATKEHAFHVVSDKQVGQPASQRARGAVSSQMGQCSRFVWFMPSSLSCGLFAFCAVQVLGVFVL